jgi:hypothetical protein
MGVMLELVNTLDLHVHEFASAPHGPGRRIDAPALGILTLLVLAVALLVPAIASVLLMAAPDTMTASTYSISATMLVGLAALTLPRLPGLGQRAVTCPDRPLMRI